MLEVCGGRPSEDLASLFRSLFPKKRNLPVIDGKRASRINRWASRGRDRDRESMRTMIDKDLRGVADWSRCAFEKGGGVWGAQLKTVHAKRGLVAEEKLVAKSTGSIIRKFTHPYRSK